MAASVGNLSVHKAYKISIEKLAKTAPEAMPEGASMSCFNAAGELPLGGRSRLLSMIIGLLELSSSKNSQDR